MYLLTEKTIHIRRPAAAVFAYVSNMEKFGEWFPGVLAIASSNAQPHGQPGKEYLETAAVPFRGMRQITLQVREVRGHAFFATEGRLALLLPRMEIALQATGPDACELTWRMLSRSNSRIVRYLLLPFARRVLDKRAALGVARLKSRLEAARV